MILIAILYEGENLLKSLTSQITIDSTLISPTLGTNVKLILSTDSTQYFTGVCTKLNASIQNAITGIYNSMVLDGVDNTGTKKTLTITIENLQANTYGIYDKLYWSNNINAATPAVSVEDTTSLVNSSATVQVFDTDFVKVGALFTCTKADGTRIDGVVTAVDPLGTKVTVATIVNNRPSNVVVSLVDATTVNFTGEIITIVYE